MQLSTFQQPSGLPRFASGQSNGTQASAEAPKFGGRFWYDTEFRDRGGQLDFISIGMVDEKGRKFYAVCDETAEQADDTPWFNQHILGKLGPEGAPEKRMSREEIRDGIVKFIGKDRNPSFWAYNDAYDVVNLCQLFGGMKGLYSKFNKVGFFDIKQLSETLGRPALPAKPPDEHNALADAGWDKSAFQVLDAEAQAKGIPVPA